MLNDHIISKNPTELSYIKRSVFIEVVEEQSECSFEIRVNSGTDIPKYEIVRFQRRDSLNNQKLNKDSFSRPLFTFSQCFAGTDKYPKSW